MRKQALICLLLTLCLLPVTGSASGIALPAYDHYIGRQHYLYFGQYVGADGELSPLLWRVLKKDARQVMLLSEHVLDIPEGQEAKAWLEGGFQDAAFDAAQQAILYAHKGQSPLRLMDGKLLDDKNLGMAEDKARMAKEAGGAGAPYWLREFSQKDKALQRYITLTGQSEFAPPQTAGIGVRPVLLLDTRKMPSVSGEGSLKNPYVFTGLAQLLIDESPQPIATPPIEKAMQSDERITINGFPPLTSEGFLPEGEAEYVLVDETKGAWRYANQDLRIEITRHTKEGERLRWLTAEIFTRPGSGTFLMAPYDKDNMLQDLNKYLEKQEKIARQHNLVFTMGGDYFIYRLGSARRDKMIRAVGVIIRDGRIVVDKPAIPDRTFLPPLDHLAIFPDGDMKVYGASEITAQELVDLGARDVLSFGPWLIRDGQINSSYSTYGTTLQPRSMIGMVEKGHYWAVVVEGRIGPSNGLTLADSTLLMKDLGCTLAYNLDGGWTSAMIFMGKQLNQLDKNGVRNNARTQNEVLGIGYTEAYIKGTHPGD